MTNEELKTLIVGITPQPWSYTQNRIIRTDGLSRDDTIAIISREQSGSVQANLKLLLNAPLLVVDLIEARTEIDRLKTLIIAVGNDLDNSLKYDPDDAKSARKAIAVAVQTIEAKI